LDSRFRVFAKPKVRTLPRLKHATSLGPQTLAYALVKNYQAKPAQLEHLAQCLTDTMTG
jgi:hypothetical protein